MPPEESLVPPGGGIPAFILDEGIVTPQVHGHGTAAPGAAGHQLRGDPHVPLFRKHFADGLLVVIGLLMAGLGALPKAIVPLGVEQPLLVEARQLELVVHIGGQDKVILVLYQLQQIVIHGLRRLFIAVHQDLPAPPGPVLLQTFKGIESAGVHVPDAVPGLKVAEIPPEPFPGVGHPRGGGQARPRPDHHCVCRGQGLLQPLNRVRGDGGRWLRPGL